MSLSKISVICSLSPKNFTPAISSHSLLHFSSFSIIHLSILLFPMVPLTASSYHTSSSLLPPKFIFTFNLKHTLSLTVPLTGLIIYRDVLIVGGASYVRYKSLPPPVSRRTSSFSSLIYLSYKEWNIGRQPIKHTNRKRLTFCLLLQRTLFRYFDASHATARLAPTAISKFNTAVQLSLITAALAVPIFTLTDHVAFKALW